jgi:hypothetical protein
MMGLKKIFSNSYLHLSLAILIVLSVLVYFSYLNTMEQFSSRDPYLLNRKGMFINDIPNGKSDKSICLKHELSNGVVLNGGPSNGNCGKCIETWNMNSGDDENTSFHRQNCLVHQTADGWVNNGHPPSGAKCLKTSYDHTYKWHNFNTQQSD